MNGELNSRERKPPSRAVSGVSQASNSMDHRRVRRQNTSTDYNKIQDKLLSDEFNVVSEVEQDDSPLIRQKKLHYSPKKTPDQEKAKVDSF